MVLRVQILLWHYAILLVTGFLNQSLLLSLLSRPAEFQWLPIYFVVTWLCSDQILCICHWLYVLANLFYFLIYLKFFSTHCLLLPLWLTAAGMVTDPSALFSSWVYFCCLFYIKFGREEYFSGLFAWFWLILCFDIVKGHIFSTLILQMPFCIWHTNWSSMSWIFTFGKTEEKQPCQ